MARAALARTRHRHLAHTLFHMSGTTGPANTVPWFFVLADAPAVA